MIDRRTLITGTATVLATAAVPVPADAVTKLVGIDDQPYAARKFTGSGWYAFGQDGEYWKRVMWAELDQGGFLPGAINLSDGPGKRVAMTFSAQFFDRTCWGIFQLIREAGL